MEYCEHNCKSIYIDTLYGKHRTYSCTQDKRRGSDCIGGFSEPCIAECTNHFRKPNGERGHSFPYKRIDFGAIPFDKKALQQIEEDKIERHQKAESLRNKALSLIKEADKLEGSNPWPQPL